MICKDLRFILAKNDQLGISNPILILSSNTYCVILGELTKLFLLFFNFWLRWVFVASRGLSLVAVSEDHSSLPCAGFWLRCLLLVQSTGCRCAGSVVVAHGPIECTEAVVHRLRCSKPCGIFLDQGSNPCPQHWQEDFSSTVPPGKSWLSFLSLCFLIYNMNLIIVLVAYFVPKICSEIWETIQRKFY